MALKKVVYLLEYPIDLPGGAQMSTLSICEGLSAHPEYGYEPVVICPELLSRRKEDYAFRILTYPMGEKRIPNLWKRIRYFKKYLQEGDYSLIHIQMSESLITYGFIRRFFGKLPYIYTDRGLFFGYRKRSLFFMLPALKRSRMLVTTTDFNRRLWEEGSKIRPISVIPNTINDKLFGSYDEQRRRGRKHAGFTLGLAGRICVEKDWPFAVEFVKALKTAGLDFRVDLVLSTFEKGDDEKVRQITEGIREAVGEGNLEVHLNHTQEQMADYYYDVDVFLMTSSFESFGKAALEAMSRKCAVVSSRAGGLPEVIGKEENLYDRQGFEKGVRYVKMLAENPEKLEKDREFFYNRYRSLYTEEKYIERHRRLYDEII
ncbi:MAG: glycosyltransferase family 4 protein [Lachnospiraceae bacterium]|nr:glycosyltransferase family 4 protein [Lachnospiraceae bacterium]